MSRRASILLLVLAVAGWFALAVANLFMGELNQDEGWYLYAARLVSEGQLPFRDFAFTQGPMLPLVYGLGHAWTAAWGLAGGRALTALLGFVAALAAAAFAARISAPQDKGSAAILAFILIALNVYHSYFTTVVKTYSLCALFLTTGFVFAARARHRKSALLFAMAGVAFAAAAATRITAGISLAAVGVWLLLARKQLGDRAWIAFGLGGGFGLALFLGSFYALAPEAFHFFMLDYHAHREAGSALATVAFKVGLVSRVTQGYFVAIAVGLALVLARICGLARGAGERDGLVLAGWATLAGIALVQASAPVPYDDYQVPLFPLFAALLAAAVFRLPALRAPRATAVALWVALALNGAAAMSSPVNQAWMVIGRDRIWWRLREKPALLQLREAAAQIRTLSGDAHELLTQDTYLAVETGLRVPRGWEMGIFSYYPDWSRDRAEKLHVLNRELLEETLAATPARAAALSDYSFSVAAPAVAPLPSEESRALWNLIEAHYTPVGEIPYFGQGNTTLRLYSRAP
ncbi:MAG: hypothetical protein M9935_04925 [Kiritimatiellae bacterium]|nr:hypothetical protein [Kiritimatiellia bacterium]